MKIFALAQNYPDHIAELNQSPEYPAEPVVFLKPDSALLLPGKPFFVPDHLGRIDYEAEVVVKICRLGKNIPERFAHRYYSEATLGIDFTARDVQRECKQKGLPWTLAKGFDGAAALGEWINVDEIGSLQNTTFRLDVNGQPQQEGYTHQMIHSIDHTISFISQFFTLKTGDIIFTGTPAGSKPVAIGDILEGYLAGRKVLNLRCK